MKASKSVYVCSECDYQSSKWLGKCPSCGGYLNFDSGKDWGYIDDDPCATVAEFRSKYAGKEK